MSALPPKADIASSLRNDSEMNAGESKFGLSPTLIGLHLRYRAARCPVCAFCPGEQRKSREVIGEGTFSSIAWPARPFLVCLPHRICDRHTCQFQLACDLGRLSAWRLATFFQTERWRPRLGAPAPLLACPQ